MADLASERAEHCREEVTVAFGSAVSRGNRITRCDSITLAVTSSIIHIILASGPYHGASNRENVAESSCTLWPGVVVTHNLLGLYSCYLVSLEQQSLMEMFDCNWLNIVKP